MKLLMHEIFGVCEWERTSPGEGEARVETIKYADCEGNGGKREASGGQN